MFLGCKKQKSSPHSFIYFHFLKLWRSVVQVVYSVCVCVCVWSSIWSRPSRKGSDGLYIPLRWAVGRLTSLSSQMSFLGSEKGAVRVLNLASWKQNASVDFTLSGLHLGQLCDGIPLPRKVDNVVFGSGGRQKQVPSLSLKCFPLWTFLMKCVYVEVNAALEWSCLLLQHVHRGSWREMEGPDPELGHSVQCNRAASLTWRVLWALPFLSLLPSPNQTFPVCWPPAGHLLAVFPGENNTSESQLYLSRSFWFSSSFGGWKG